MNITWENYELIESAPNNQKQPLKVSRNNVPYSLYRGLHHSAAFRIEIQIQQVHEGQQMPQHGVDLLKLNASSWNRT